MKVLRSLPADRGNIVCRFAMAIAVSSLALTSVGVTAQAFPSKRMTIVVPNAPGGISDLIARMLAPSLSERFGQTVIVENRPGMAGVASGARSDPDGHTITLIATAHLTNSMVASQATVNLEKDLAPITEVVRYYSMLVVKPEFPAKNMAEIIALAKSKSDGLTNGTAGVGSSPHIAMELISRATDMKVLNVPYKGEGPEIIAILGGEVDMGFVTLSGVGPLLKAGKVRGIGVNSMKRVAEFPDVPAISETVPGFEYVSWVGLAVPASTPRDRIEILNKGFTAALEASQVRRDLLGRGFEVIGGTPEQFAARIRSDAEVLGKVVQSLNIKAD